MTVVRKALVDDFDDTYPLLKNLITPLWLKKIGNNYS